VGLFVRKAGRKAASVANPFPSVPDGAWESAELITIAAALSKRPEARAVPAMLEAVSICVPLRARLGSAIDRRLEAMSASDVAAWGAAGERLLLRWLRVAVQEYAGRRRFQSILHGLELVGTERAVANIRELAQHGDPEVRGAATRCCDAVKMRVALWRPGRELLRAGCAPKSSAAEMLRSSRIEVVTPSSDLLRPRR
ncbi:MAG TPA: hypothetical protein VKT77_19150, partial [Chthonomonadaceae bacterium]|nr:hypothetical protein [Chthonomonadaceae bacterium]